MADSTGRLSERSGGVLYVVAKAPRAGEAKTRLCPPLTPAEAAALAQAFLADTLRLVKRAGVHARLICRDEAERALLAEITGEQYAIAVQSGDDVGGAMRSAIRAGHRDAYPAAGVIGTDVPSLSPAVIRQAFDAVRSGGIALGPSADGGYYLLVAGEPCGALFDGMPWSTSRVFDETLARCRRLGLAVHVLPPWRDVDNAADLAWLRRSLLTAPGDAAPETRRVLARLSAGTQRTLS